MNLPCTGNADPYKTNQFCEKLQMNVNTLDTMGKLREINGYVRFSLDKNGGIRADLMRMDDKTSKTETFQNLLKHLDNEC